MSFKTIVKLKDVSLYSKEKIQLADLNEKNYVSTENLLPNFGGKEVSSGLPNVLKVNKYVNKDILVSNIRPYFKKIWQASDTGGASNDVLIFSPTNRIHPDFLYYSLANDHFFEYVMSGSKGTKMPRGDKKHIMEYELILPELNEQANISKVFIDIDKKIENNNQINNILENMAQAIFKQWFVDFEFPNEDGEPYKSSGGQMVESELGMIPEGWEVKRIKELNLYTSDYVANGSFKSLKENVNLYEEENYAVFMRNTDLKNGFKSMKFTDKHSYEFLSKSVLFGNEVIISNVADVGSVYLCPDLARPMTLGNNVIMLKSNTDSKLNYFYYRLFKSREGQHLLGTITSGSAQLKFNKTDFRNLSICYPEAEKMGRYLDIEHSIEESIQKNNKESRKLIKLRDTLLPKLMSGEIRVPLDNN
ncbi:restriction endonuclease subunit S [Peptostreptococcaceae bacterium AGR-M142]